MTRGMNARTHERTKEPRSLFLGAVSSARASRIVPRRGIAMLLVLSTVAMATVLGLGMLAAATLQGYTAQNASTTVAADALAESGVDLACYYLIHPEKAPLLNPDYWPGQTGITFGSAVAGSVDVSVNRIAKDTVNNTATYTITSTGKSASGLQRVETCTVLVNLGFQVKYCTAYLGTSLTIPAGSVITSDMQVNGSVSNYGTVTGKGIVKAWSNPAPGKLFGSLLPYATTDLTSIPKNNVVNTYNSYVYQGKTYSAKTLPAIVAAGTTLGPTADNPAGVFYANGQLEIQGNTIISGTLVSWGGPLKITGSNVSVTSFSGFPAAVIHGDLQLVRSTLWTPQVTFNGLAWLDGNLKSPLSGGGSSTPGNLTVNGALLSPQGAIDIGIQAKVYINQNKTSVADVNLDTTVLPAGVFFKSFK